MEGEVPIDSKDRHHLRDTNDENAKRHERVEVVEIDLEQRMIRKGIRKET